MMGVIFYFLLIRPQQKKAKDLQTLVSSLKTGDKVVLTLGVPVLERGKTNTIRVYTVGREDLKRLPDGELPLRCKDIGLLGTRVEAQSAPSTTDKN